MKTFEESQKFKQWWLWLLLVAIVLYFIYGIFQQLYLHKPFGDEPASDLELVSIFALMLFVMLLFFYLRLDTKVDSTGVSYRFFPFQLNYKLKKWEEMEKVYVRKYNPILEYGGWGLRIGLFGKGGAFNVSGNMGLQLELKNGKRFLLGTQKPEEMEKAVKEFSGTKS